MGESWERRCPHRLPPSYPSYRSYCPFQTPARDSVWESPAFGRDPVPGESPGYNQTESRLKQARIRNEHRTGGTGINRIHRMRHRVGANESPDCRDVFRPRGSRPDGRGAPTTDNAISHSPPVLPTIRDPASGKTDGWRGTKSACADSRGSTGSLPLSRELGRQRTQMARRAEQG